MSYHDVLMDLIASGPDIGDLYGCEKYRECHTQPKVAPPYDPSQPVKCRTHHKRMTTKIVEWGQ